LAAWLKCPDFNFTNKKFVKRGFFDNVYTAGFAILNKWVEQGYQDMKK
jgi:hypothetical protein